MRQPDLPGGDAPEGAEVDELDEDDAWVEAQSLVGTVEDHELTDPAVPVERLLYRLFHERGVRVFDAVAVRDKCSCSRERIDGMLRTLHGRGDRRQHRGRRDLGHLRVLRHEIRASTRRSSRAVGSRQ